MKTRVGFREALVEWSDEHAVEDVEFGETAGEAEEADEGVEVLQGVDDGSACETPAGLGSEVGCCESGFGFGVADLVGFVEDDSAPFNRVEAVEC